MYHEVTYEELRKRKRRRIWALAGAVVALVLVGMALWGVRLLQREQGVATLRQAVLDAALQCRAVEGSYPSTLAHLQQHYGLVINERAYQVTYQWLGDNIAPSVAVRAL